MSTQIALDRTHANIRQFQRLAMARMRKTAVSLDWADAMNVELHSKPEAQEHQVWLPSDFRKVWNAPVIRNNRTRIMNAIRLR